MGKIINMAGGFVRYVYRTVLNLVFPSRCPICDKVQEKRMGGICPGCRKKISYIREPRCMKCGKQLMDDEQEYCRDCTSYKHLFRQGRALYNYETVAGALHRFKYKGKKEYGEIFGEEISFFLGDYIRRIGPDALVPVPMYSAKRRIRGYNQAEVLAAAVGRKLGLPVEADLVRRVRNTRALKALNPKERLNNLKNAFILAGNGVKLSTIIIVDDIYTTGSTIDAVANVLREAGVKNIYFIALAIGEGN